MSGDTSAQESGFREPCYVEFAVRTWVNEPISEDTQERKETVTEEQSCAYPTVRATTVPGADYPRTESESVTGDGDRLAQEDGFVEPCRSDFAFRTWLNEPTSKATQIEKARRVSQECVEEVVPCPSTLYSCPEGHYFTQGYLGAGVLSDDCRFLRAPAAQSFSSMYMLFQNPTQGADKLEVAIRTRHDTSVPSWTVDMQLITPDPISQTFTGVLTNEFEDIVGAKLSGPWTMGNLASLRLFLGENVTLSNLDISGVEIRLYNASDVLLETIYPNEVVSLADGIFRYPILDTAPLGTLWVDRTDVSFWTPNAGFTWNVGGGYWDINATGPPGQLFAAGIWNNGLKPLAMRLTHDAVPTGTLDGLASAVRYGRRLNYASGDVVDFAEVDLWSQDMDVISWGFKPAGAKITKIEFLEC